MNRVGVEEALVAAGAIDAIHVVVHWFTEEKAYGHLVDSRPHKGPFLGVRSAQEETSSAGTTGRANPDLENVILTR